VTLSDIAGLEHWDRLYEAKGPVHAGWHPRTYDEQVLAHALVSEIERFKPRTLLEVGCGNSTWLPYLALRTGATVAGIDYSDGGCEMARERLRTHEVEGQVWCGDLFQLKPEDVGQYDFVFSLGLVEHFSDLEGVLSALLKFVRPGGVLFTEVPNLCSVHGLMVWAWQPELMRKHELVRKRPLKRAYKRLGLNRIRSHYLGVFSLLVVAWEIYARWPRLARRMLPMIDVLVSSCDRYLRRLGWVRGTAPFAHYLYAVGQKPTTQQKLAQKHETD
jgi:2-polyprenyl-3-methyl-5-hydroxy-6-metoxy-1,4-benzoquinol methylase